MSGLIWIQNVCKSRRRVNNLGIRIWAFLVWARLTRGLFSWHQRSVINKPYLGTCQNLLKLIVYVHPIQLYQCITGSKSDVSKGQKALKSAPLINLICYGKLNSWSRSQGNPQNRFINCIKWTDPQALTTGFLMLVINSWILFFSMFNSLPASVVCRSHLQTVWNQIRLDKRYGLNEATKLTIFILSMSYDPMGESFQD